METKVKKMDKDSLLALSRLLGQGILAPSVPRELVCKELQSRGLAVPNGFEPLAVQEEEGDAFYGRQPSE